MMLSKENGNCAEAMMYCHLLEDKVTDKQSNYPVYACVAMSDIHMKRARIYESQGEKEKILQLLLPKVFYRLSETEVDQYGPSVAKRERRCEDVAGQGNG